MEKEIRIIPDIHVAQANQPAQRQAFLGFIFILVLALLPIYAFSSGGFQIVDVPLVLIILLVLLSNYEKDIYLTLVYYLIPFTVWATLVNATYFIFNNDLWFLKATIVVVYSPILLYVFTRIFINILNNGNIIIIYSGLILSVILSFIVKGPPSEEERSILSFNDPNQLGYFAAILLSYVILLIKYKEFIKYKKLLYYAFDAIIIIVAHYFLLLALSRSAIAAFIVLDLCLLKNMLNLKIIFPLIIFGGAAIIAFSILNPKFIEERMHARDSSHYSKEEIERGLESRVLDPIWRMEGIEFLFGKGQGGLLKKRGSVSVVQGKPKGYGGESHNMFGEVFRAYGIIGLTLFLVWLIKAIWRSRHFHDGLWIWAGLMLYNFGNYGIRFRAFWILLAFLLAMAGFLYLRLNEDQTG
jgi:hypothetical protein